MKQYKITSADFFTPGDQDEPNAVMSDEDLATMRKEAGLDQLGVMKKHDLQHNSTQDKKRVS